MKPSRTGWLRGALPPWARRYQRHWFSQDLTAGAVVAVMLIPQSLGYAMLAGLPAQVGLYASIAPLVAYALFGSSMSLAVGPVAVSSLMTASAIAAVGAVGADAVAVAALLALMAGAMLLMAGALRLGFIANLLSHPVVAGFTSGSAVLIIIAQVGPLIGLSSSGHAALERLLFLAINLPHANAVTAATGSVALILLWAARRHLGAGLRRLGLNLKVALLGARLAPMVIVLGGSLLVNALDLDVAHGLAVVGSIPQGLPDGLPHFPWQQFPVLLLPALIIATVNYVESISVAQSLALRRKERVLPDAELKGLGAANLASALSGGFPVAGGFARSVVNDAAGARTPLAGVISAAGMLAVLLGPAQVFEKLPLAVLAATIIVAVVPLIDLAVFRRAWRYDRADAAAYAATALVLIGFGIEAGIATGVLFSLGNLVWRSSRPHIAIVGRIPGTEHFRNVERHAVETLPGVLAVRIDESLLFTNARAIEERLRRERRRQEDVEDVLLVMTSVSQIDLTAIDALTELAREWQEEGVRLSLAEVKGPVNDRLQRSELPALIEGRQFLSTHAAFLFFQEAQRGSRPHPTDGSGAGQERKDGRVPTHDASR